MNDPEEDAIRDLLRSARAEAPMPADVAARLDDVLAGLAAEPEPTPAPVVPLRRRLAPRVLAVAAALVVVVGGAGVVMDQVQEKSADLESSQSAEAGASVEADRDEKVAPQAPGTLADSAPQRLELRRQQLGPDLRQAAKSLLSSADVGTLSSGSATPAPESSYDTASGKACPLPPLAQLDDSRWGLVRLDQRAAVLVVGAAGAQGDRRVELWTCAPQELVSRESLNLG